MKRIFVVSVMAIILLMPLIGAVNLTKSDEDNQELVKNISTYDFTHTVLVEYASKSTCPHCPTASSQLYSIYDSGDYPFYYVTMVTDKIASLPLGAQSRIYPRINELGVEYIPDVYFDGGLIQLTGKQSDEQPYRDSIIQSGERAVPDIDVSVNVDWIGIGIIKISVTVQDNEVEKYEGKLRVYVTKIESEWTDALDNPYHYTVLDIPVDKSLTVVHQNVKKQDIQNQDLEGSYTFTKIWAGDITKDNCMVVAAVFDKDTDYAVQAASAFPSSANTFDKINNDLPFSTFFKLLEKFSTTFQLIRNIIFQ